jgi:hypothetical protein
MSLRACVERLEKLHRPDSFCPGCAQLTFRFASQPGPRPPVCPRCARGPGDYPPGIVRGFIIHLPSEQDLK